MRRQFLLLFLTILIVTPASAAWAQTTGCCISPGDTCLNNYSSIQCDALYPGGAPAGKYFSSDCTQVSFCQETGKCENKNDSTQCTDGTRYDCDAKQDVNYIFYQGQQCGVAPALGTCCVEPNPSGPRPTCIDNLTQIDCQSRLWQYYGQSCYNIPNCSQVSTGSSPQIDSSSATASTLDPINFKPEVPLPNFVGGPVSADTLTQYIRALFIAFIGVVGILATVMVIYGGVKWVAAAGNPGRINDARDIINNAIIGVIIALTSVVLLNLINGRLTDFSGITLIPVTGTPYESDNTVGLNGEGAGKLGCTTKKGHPIQQETKCAISGLSLVWPVGGDAPQTITSSVGPRNVQNASGASSCHPGTDFSTNHKTGEPIIAMTGGTVSLPGNVCGEPSIIINGSNFKIRYLHVSQLNVTNGQTVRANDVIGFSGGSKAAAGNCSSGPHSHIELYSSDGEIHDISACMGQ